MKYKYGMPKYTASRPCELPVIGINAGDTAIAYGNRYIWYVCPSCKNGRWVPMSLIRKSKFTGLCAGCFQVLQCANNEYMRKQLDKLKESGNHVT